MVSKVYFTHAYVVKESTALNHRYFKEEKPVAGMALRRLKAQDQAEQTDVPLRSSVCTLFMI